MLIWGSVHMREASAGYLNLYSAVLFSQHSQTCENSGDKTAVWCFCAPSKEDVLFVCFQRNFFTASVYVEATEVYRPVWLQTSVGKHCWEAAPAFYFLSEKQNAVSH